LHDPFRILNVVSLCIVVGTRLAHLKAKGILESGNRENLFGVREKYGNQVRLGTPSNEQ
jgi:hypothetical protein